MSLSENDPSSNAKNKFKASSNSSVGEKTQINIRAAHGQPLIDLAQAHFASQALNAVVQLGIPDTLGDEKLTIREIACRLNNDESKTISATNEEALLRTMRLLTGVGIFEQSISDENKGDILFSLSETGKLLKTTTTTTTTTTTCDDQSDLQDESMSCFVRHWMDDALWASWPYLPDYIAGNLPSKYRNPFEYANGGKTIIDHFENNRDAKQARNSVAKYISTREISAILESFDKSKYWSSSLSGKTVVDIGGGYGELMIAIAHKFPNIKCINLDLPDVISAVSKPSQSIQMVSGDMFIPSTIPPCDAIVMKHVFCEWDDQEAQKILDSIKCALPSNGKVIIIDALLLDGPEASIAKQVMSFVDLQMMMVGGTSRMERSKSQLHNLCENCGFEIESVLKTSSISCDITTLRKI